VGKNAKKVKAVEVIRINAENVFVAAFSFRKSTSAMMLVSSRQQLGNLIQWTKGPARCHVRRSWRAQFACHSPLFSVHCEGSDPAITLRTTRGTVATVRSSCEAENRRAEFEYAIRRHPERSSTAGKR
jgi:hypothetical protein